MAARPGTENPLSGPRLPRTIIQLGPDDMPDPAKGAKVPRCLTCGTPTHPITGTFTPDRNEPYAGRGFRYRLCIRCIEHANGPQDPDPLDSTDAA